MSSPSPYQTEWIQSGSFHSKPRGQAQGQSSGWARRQVCRPRSPGLAAHLATRSATPVVAPQPRHPLPSFVEKDKKRAPKVLRAVRSLLT